MQNLRKKPTFNELINYIEIERPKIKYTDRTATLKEFPLPKSI